jgi:signal transduction histidine kinase
VENNQEHAFDEEDVEALQALADMAVVALRNAEQAEMLTRSNAVGVMGAWGAEIVHVVNREVGCIRRGVYLIQQQRDIPAEVREELNTIDQSANRLAMPEIPDRLPGYEVVPSPASSDIDSAIHTAVEAERPRYPFISFQFEAGCSDVRVATHERFIFTILRNLLRNAIHALSSEDVIEKIIWVQSCIDGSMAMIEMKNSGPNLRTEIAPLIFKRLIPHKDGRKGRGLLLVGFIIEQHGGRIETIQSAGKGVIFRFWLPLAALPEYNVETE